MSTRPHLPPETIAQIAKHGALKVRAGRAPHHFLGIWAVVVDDRVFVRSWNDKPTGWNRAFKAEHEGAILVKDREIPVRAVGVRSEKERDRVSAAYVEKYWRPRSITFAEGLDTAERRATTLELVPLRRTMAKKTRSAAKRVTRGH